ncbi:hypothetical protein RGQ29_010605 [Quercus rubra]|uniref:MATH domain-containing protein n=1 Tax=Quercus rubra TaxID=3512 RepID=A0AAN7J0M7_QUERU|nr:hypothetical protein RGQ29_010605 [Quercus rubra]
MHYTVKIKSFSLLAKNSMERYETGEFESGGYKWKLVIYPNGNKNNNVDKHMSLYLAIEAADLRPPGWEVHAIFRFFLHDQIRDNYLTIEGYQKKERLFRGIKLEWGYDKVIPLKTFNDASNGYLVDDSCVFGAEVFVSKQRSIDKEECLALIKDSITKKSVIRFDNYSKLTGESHYSAPFSDGNHKWKIRICPIGEGIGTGIYNSLYLALADPKSLLPGMKIFVDFTLRILDQENYRQPRHRHAKLSRWFNASSHEHGWNRFISISSYNLTNLGLLTRDTMLVEAEITILAVVNATS